MRKLLAHAQGAAYAGSFCALIAGVAAVSAPQSASAGDNAPVLRSAYGALPTTSRPVTAPRHHHSRITFSHRDQFPQTRHVTIGQSKSTLVELPRNLRDVIVSDPEIVDAVVQTSNRVYLIGKKIGQANAFFFDEYGEQILTLEMLVEVDTTPLDRLLARLIPGSRIKTEVMNDTLILTGSVRNPVDANRARDIAARFATSEEKSDVASNNKVINMLSVEGEEQVMLRVRVAEVQRSLLKQFGINLGARITSGNFATSLLTENALPVTSALGLGTMPIPGIGTQATGEDVTCQTGGVLCNFNAGPSDGTFGNNGLSSGWASGNASVSKAMRALERVGLVKTLAEPNLTAISGETAKFIAGGEFPVPLVNDDGGLSVTFKEYGIGLSFTPNVMSEGRISLKIDTEVSELTTDGAVTLSGIAIPALKKRQAQTIVELPSGGSLAMAGLVSEDMRRNVDGFPGLKNLPVLGTLFRSTDFVKSETELVVVVTPYMVRPTAQKNLARPGDGLVASSDKRATFLGHINKVYGRGEPLPDGGLKGDYGFIVE
jgi:pilus assembly protein CpaC